MPIEGSLRISWMNRGTADTSRYSLTFVARYGNFGHGVLKPYEIVGDEALKSYLVALGRMEMEAKNWVNQMRQGNRSVSIPTVWLPDDHLADFEPPKAAGV